MRADSAIWIRRSPSLVIVWLAIAMFAVACAAPAEETGDAPTEPGGAAAGGDETERPGDAPSGEPIRVGLNLEQSGASSVIGQANINAIELHARIINENGGLLGRPIELVLEDNATDEQQTITIARRFADDESIVAMLGPGTSPTTMAAMDVIVESGKPSISLASATAIVEPVEERPNVFKTPANNIIFAEVIAEELLRNGISRIGVISVNNPYGDSGLAGWEQVAEAQGLDIVRSEKFEATDTDMTAQLNNIVEADAEAITVNAIPPGAPTIQRNAVENLGLAIPIYYDGGAGAELFLELAGDSADGMIMSQHPSQVWDQVDSGPQAEVLQQFGTAYEEEYGEVSGFAGIGWDGLGLFAAAVEQAGTDEPAAVIDAMENLGEHVGVGGVYEITDQDHLGLTAEDLVLVTVEDGEWRILGDAPGEQSSE